MNGTTRADWEEFNRMADEAHREWCEANRLEDDTE